MVDDVFGELFLDDEAGAGQVDTPIVPPVTVPAPAAPRIAESAPVPEHTAPVATPDAPVPPVPEHADEPTAQSPAEAVSPAPPVAAAQEPAEAASVMPAGNASAPNRSDRERRLADALNSLMRENHDVEAAALVSLDGFTMASALPEGMQEDRVGAMSAAILGLGERAAAELGRGKLSQVFIEGENGYVLLMAAGDRAVLTCLADHRAKLGLVIFDMRRAAGEIGEVLG